MSAILPDWGAARPGAAGDAALSVYDGFENTAARIVLPDQLDIALEEDGKPAFLLTGIRPLVPTPANQPYSHLTFRLRAQAKAMPDQAPADASTTWQMARLARGFLRFHLSSAFGSLPPELAAPAALNWNALSATQFSLKLSPEAAILVENALLRDALPLMALAEVEVDGMAPCLPVRVTLRARAAMAILRGLAGAGGVLARASLGRHMLSDAAAHLTINGGDKNDPVFMEKLADALSDHCRVRFCKPVPTPFEDGTPVVSLPADDADVPDTLVWDLSQPLLVPRALALGFDPFEQARKLVGALGVEALVKRIVTPGLSSGFQRIAVTSNVPQRPAGVDMLALRLRFPPRPPFRPHEISKMIDVGRTATGFVDVQLGPGEPVAWLAKTIAAVAGPRGVDLIEGPETPGEGGFAFAGAAGFSVRFVECLASEAVISVADISIAVAGSRKGNPFQAVLRLSKGNRRGFLAIANDVSEAMLRIEARKPDGRIIALEPRPVEDVEIDIGMLPGYGPRSATLEVVFDDAAALAVIETSPECAPDRIESLVLTPQAPSRALEWFCADPFQPGFRWRWRARADEPERPWNGPVDAGALTILSSSKGTST
jgi:hypothetical protein